MQRHCAFLALILSVLYLGACALANHEARAQQSDTQVYAGPHIAVLLPVKSPVVGRQADAVRLGVLEAAKVHRGTTLPLVVYGEFQGGDLDASIAAAAILIVAAFGVLIAVRILHWGRALDTRRLA